MASPSKSKHWGSTYILAPLLQQSQSEVDFLSGFRASWDGSGPSGQIRAPQDKPGPSRTNQALRSGSESRWANLQNPVGATRAPQDESGHRDGSGPEGRPRAPQKKNQRTGTDQGPAGRIRASLDESEPRETEQGPVRRSRAPRNEPGPRSSN